MKITCSISLSYYKETAQGNNFSRTRYKNSSLSLVINPKDKSDVFLIYQTAQNNGQKYKIIDNVELVFTKCINEGKTTIRLKVPAVDICINSCDKIQLKCFLQTLKRVLLKDLTSLQLSTIATSTAPQLPKKKLIINGPENYDVLKSFPRTLETVKINNVMISRLDSRLLMLVNLRYLSLECNAIESLPEDLGKLQISELYLGSNRLGRYPHSCNWKWMSGHVISKSLKSLHMENNELRCIPFYLIRLKQLISLRIDNNLLTELPMFIGRLPNLNWLSISNNKLKWLPTTLDATTGLSFLDYCANEFHEFKPDCMVYKKSDFNTVIPTLLDHCALKIAGNRLKNSDGIIPVDLLDYMYSMSRCICFRSTVCTSPVGYIHFQNKFASSSTVTDTLSSRPISKFNFCSYMCYKRCKNTL